jgi:adenine-specific DNA glycosylase
VIQIFKNGKLQLSIHSFVSPKCTKCPFRDICHMSRTLLIWSVSTPDPPRKMSVPGTFFLPCSPFYLYIPPLGGSLSTIHVLLSQRKHTRRDEKTWHLIIEVQEKKKSVPTHRESSHFQRLMYFLARSPRFYDHCQSSLI